MKTGSAWLKAAPGHLFLRMQGLTGLDEKGGKEQIFRKVKKQKLFSRVGQLPAREAVPL